MEQTPRSIAWEAPGHHHVEKGNDWFFALAIIIVALVIVAILFDNMIISVLVGLAGTTLAISAAKKPAVIPFSVSVRGVKIDDRLYPFSEIDGYHIDEEDHKGPQLLLRSSRKIMPLLVMPIPVDYIDDIEDLLKDRVKEEKLEEPLLVKILELFGF
ncbi:hypothetical protein KC926_00300 [Candidatus Kaiserbacteria bacterium]|nr:hypothetical protein [Candidatus Kaiserbacteria bacterium]